MPYSILEELYNGNICPDRKIHAPDSDFVRYARVKCDNLDKLMASMSDEQKEAFEAYTEANGEIEGIMTFGRFTYGLKFGMLLMMEVLQGKEEM